MRTTLNRNLKRSPVNAVGLTSRKSESGFSLVEVTIALLIIMIALFGVVHAITYAITYNYGNKMRGQALSALQKEIELLRSKKYTLAFTDADLAGGTHTKTVTTNTGIVFPVVNEVDNEPNVDGIQNDSYQCLTPQGVATPCSFKEITITVQMPENAPEWSTFVPLRAVLRRARGN